MSPTDPTPRAGRRPGPTDSREKILMAARARFATAGYDGTSVRAVAREAAVDAALVHHFFGTKHGLFLAALAVPVDPATVLPAVIDGDPDRLGERLVTFYLGLLESPVTREPILAVLKAAMTNDAVADLVRVFVGREIVGTVSARLRTSQPALRATLAASQLVGLGLARYVVGLEPLASAPVATVVALVAPTLQRYLSGELPQAG